MIDPAERLGHILVVDDDPRIRQMLTRYFEQEGYQVCAAADGVAMRAQLNAKPIDKAINQLI
jgi:two-component system OmpR family response regulator